MFSLTAIVTSVAALALAVTLVVPSGSVDQGLVPGAPTAVTHVVAADGSGDFSTVGEAVEAAADGDTILIKPGQYVEALVIDKDVTVQGDGDREEIVITCREDAPPFDLGSEYAVPFPVRIHSDATLQGVTIVAPSGGGAVAVSGGAPLLQDLRLALEPGGMGALALGGGSTPVIAGSLIEGQVATEATGLDAEISGSTPTFEGNTFQGTEAMLNLNGPGEAIVRGNTFLDGAGIAASDGETARIEGNIIRGPEEPGSPTTGVHVGSDSDLQVHGNTVSGMPVGISVQAMGTAVVDGNELTDNGIGVAWGSTQSGTIADNSIRGGSIGMTFTAGAPVVTGNTVDAVSFRGIAVGSHASPSLSGNTVCGCGANVWLAEGAEPQMGENEICADESSG